MGIQITPVLCGMIQENAYIVAAPGRGDCVVVDPGDEYPKLKRAVGNRRVGAILLTHGHFDHIRAAGEMAADFGAPVYAAAGDMEMLNDANLNGYAGLMGVTEMDGPEIAAVPFGERLAVCGLDFAIIPTPGHSKGSVCLYLEDEGALRAPREVTWVFLLRQRPEWRDGRITAGGLSIRCPDGLSFRAEEKPVEDARMARNWPGSLWRVTLTGGKADAFQARFLFTAKDREEKK